MIQRLSFVILLLLLPGLAHALGLGKLELRSNLNEPFEARINLISPTVDELASLNILLADQDAFQRAGIQRAAVLRHLRFTVIEPEAGPDYIRIFSDEPIREPYLNFLLELNWSKGRLFREYTVLLDPPIYAAKQQRLKSLEPESPKPPAVSDEPRAIEDNQVVYNPEYTPPSPPTVSAAAPAPAPATPIDYAGGDYGPVEAGNTLWSIASAMRPDASVSVQQMMLALLRANPEAFINNNINGLKRGYVLRMPDLSGIRQVSKADAFAEAKQQNLAWEGVAPAAPVARAEGAAVAEPEVSEVEAADTGAEAEGEAELRLVAAAEEGEGAAGGEPTTEELNQELALVNESLEALKQENLELQDKLIESEAIIDDLRRLIVLKEEELATLQQQIAAREAETAAAEAESMAAEEPMEEAMAPEETMEEEPMEPAVTGEMAEEEAPPLAEDTGEEAGAVAETAEEAPVTEVSLMDKVKGFFSGLIPETLFSDLAGIVQGNIAWVGGGLGGLILLLLGGAYIKRRQSEKATEIPASEFPDFDDMDDTVAADTETGESEATDINPALSESEDVTETPVSEDEGLGDFDLTSEAEDEEKTQIAAPEVADEFEATTTEKPAAAGATEEDEDRLAEVNVFLAYEHFDQAADFVKDAIEEQPDNLEFHSKLLEVYYAAGDKKNYEEAARVLHDKVGGKGEYWDMAVAMWQEMSPNRALFEAPAAGEEEEETGAKTEGGGIVNIAGDEETAASATGLDFDLDTTGGATEEEEPVTDEEEADVLDVTAAVGEDEEDEVLDLTSAGEEESDSLDFSFDEPAEEATPEKEEAATTAGDEETGESGLDISLGETEDNALDFSLDESSDISEAETEDKGTEASLSDSESNSLDFSIGGEEDTAADETDEDESGLDVSLGDTGEGEDSSLDFSVHAASESTAEAADEDLEISLGDTGEGDESSLDLSVDEAGSASETGGDLDISLGDTGEGDESSLDLSVDEAGSASETGGDLDISLGDTGEGDESSLDLSVDEAGSGEDTGEGNLDVSPGDTGDDSSLDFSVTGTEETGESSVSGHDPLDVTSSVTSEEGEESEDILNLSEQKDEDLLDVTSSVSYEPEDDEELLDVTSATGAGVDRDELIEVETDEDDSAKTGEDSGIDFDNGSMDRDAGDSSSVELDISVPDSESDEKDDDELTLDVTGGTESEGSDSGLDLEFGDEGGEPDTGEASDIDMDATMEIPKSSTATGNNLELDDSAGEDQGADASGFDLEIDTGEEEIDDEDQTVFVGRSADTEEQSDEDEIATQLDLAKAYIELGDMDNAKTILNEIISIGNDQQRQQAEELLSQV